MTGQFFLDWAILTISLFNTILMLWMGLTVLLTAERRTWGVWLIGGSLLIGGVFFVSHTAIVGFGLVMTRGLDFWWHAGWWPVVALPFAWYLVTLWYAGFWEDRQTPLHRRQRSLFALVGLLTLGLVGLLLFANPLPSFAQAAQLNLSATPAVGGLPLLIVTYPIDILLCLSLSLDALLRPGPTARVMGDLARRRARPWLVATTVVLLVVSLLVAWVMVWVVSHARGKTLSGLFAATALTIGWFDLAIAALIALAALLVGQAVVEYEVFTGKALPRHGFRRHWRNAVILAAGYGLSVGWSLTVQLRPIYSLLLTALLMTAFYALFSWRSFAERDRTMRQLRPFVASQQLYARLLTSFEPAEADALTPFRALCANVLGARRAYLIALGPFAPLVGPALRYPESQKALSLSFSEIAARFDSPQLMCLPLDPARHGGAQWAVPLWGERGLIGMLLLGEKSDGGLYTQEEIETARASGERLIDARASAEMARRLMALQRQRFAESQLLDRQARRVLHDDVLPQLHAAMLALNGAKSDSGEAIASLGAVHHRISDLLRRMPSATAPEIERVGLVGALRRMLDDDLKGAFDSVAWDVEPGIEAQLQTLPALTTEVLFYAAREAMRNAARYGRPDSTRPLRLRVGVNLNDGVKILIEDDGVGMDPARDSERGSGQGLA
ncbi:MAG: sensor histidine kinase, partial [Anaerolineales bacterium]